MALNGGNVTWSNVSNAGTTGGSYATNACGADGSNTLQGSNCGFSTSGTIGGITFLFSRLANNDSGSSYVNDDSVYLIVSSPGTTPTVSANNYAATGTKYPLTAAIATYGTGTTDLWGSSWTSTIVNGSGFGALLAIQGQKSADDCSVNSWSITVYCTGSVGPGAPSGLTITGTTSTSISFSWTQGSGTVTDNEYAWVQINGWDGDTANLAEAGQTVVDIGSAATSATLTGLTPNTMYFLAVRAGDSGTWGNWSPIAIAFTGNYCTLRTSTDDTTTGWTLQSGSGFASNLSTGIAGLDNGTYTLSTMPNYAAAPTGGGSGSPLVMTLGSLPGDFGTPLVVGLNIVLLSNVGMGNDQIGVYLYESDGVTSLITSGGLLENIDQLFSDATQFVFANTGPSATANWLNAQINLQMPSSAGNQTKVYGVELVVGYLPPPPVYPPVGFNNSVMNSCSMASRW